MLTTGLKHMIINRKEDISFDAAEGILSLFGATNVKKDDVKNLAIYQTKATAGGKYNYALTVPAGAIAAGDVVTIGIDFTTMRNHGEMNNDRLDGSDKMTIQVVASGTSGDTLAADITAEIMGTSELQQERRRRYKLTAVTNPGAPSSDVLIEMNEWAIVPKEVKILSSSGLPLGVTYVRTVSTPPVEGIGLPKMLEEKAKHDTFRNTSMYAKNPNGQINKNATYNVIEIDVAFDSAYSMNGSVVNGANAKKAVSYQVWVDSAILLDDAAVKVYNVAVAGFFFSDSAPTLAATEKDYAEADTAKIYV